MYKVRGVITSYSIHYTKLYESEFIKIAYIILLSRRLEKCREIGVKNLNIIGNIFPLFFIPILIFLGEDLGTTLHYFAITGVMLFASSIDKKIIISVVLLLTLAVRNNFV